MKLVIMFDLTNQLFILFLTGIADRHRDGRIGNTTASFIQGALHRFTEPFTGSPPPWL